MTDIGAYIGAFDASDDDIPHRISPWLSDSSKIFSWISVRENAWHGFGAVKATCTKQQLIEFADEFNIDREIKTYIQGLDADKLYVLAAYETGDDY